MGVPDLRRGWHIKRFRTSDVAFFVGWRAQIQEGISSLTNGYMWVRELFQNVTLLLLSFPRQGTLRGAERLPAWVNNRIGRGRLCCTCVVVGGIGDATAGIFLGRTGV